MIDTNLLVSIGNSIITNFTNVVSVRQDCVPKTPADFHRLMVGTPYSPIGVQVTITGGTTFAIRDGAVNYFESPYSVFSEQNPDQLGKYAGTSILTSNQVFLIASNTLQSLIKTKHVLTNGAPRIEQAGVFEGKRLPFFHVEWPHISDSPHGADLEIDGRNGKIVFVHLMDDVFLIMLLHSK